MRVLIIGGTIFFGRHLCQSLLSAGHKVTMFNRGRQTYFPPNSVETIVGDRDLDLSILSGRSWDVVVDTCGYLPAQVRRSTEVLSGKVGTYVFVSSINQYLKFLVPGLEETDSPKNRRWIRKSVLNEKNYGLLKRLCEREVVSRFKGKVIILRPGCMVGPFDQANRFSYWVKRCSLGGDMLTPGIPKLHYQIIDVRDVTDWLVNFCEGCGEGVFNLVGPSQPYFVGDLLHQIGAITGAATRSIWVEEEFLRRKPGGSRFLRLGEWANLSNKMKYLYDVNNRKVLEANLRFRPLRQTVSDIYTWISSVKSAGEVLLARPDESRLLSGWDRAKWS